MGGLSGEFGSIPLLPAEAEGLQQTGVLRLPRPLLQMLCCRRRRLLPAAALSQCAASDGSVLPRAQSQVIPDFVARMTSPFLLSADIARLWSVDRASCNALSVPGLVREIAASRGIAEGRLLTLAQLHLEEEFAFGTNVINFEFMSTDFDNSGEATLDRIAKLLRQHPSTKAVIEAHAQPGAPLDLARRVSAERAAAVAGGLERRKVERSRLNVEAFGTVRRLLQASSEREHRRAEIFITLEGTQYPAERLQVAQVRGSSSRFAAWAAALDDEFD
mmetsp:Transcript_56929/g.157559  ORF Transcript_56929/g.157559 Transcript_56929/m.157559 type:complete len:275 (+) Transcript_56929:77-901(+)